MTDHQVLTELLSQLASPFTGEVLFDHLIDTVYFVKNVSGAYVVVNATLADRCGASHKNQLIGKRPTDVVPAPYGERFEKQDRHLLDSGTPLLGELELHAYPNRNMGWCLTTKVPLRDRRNRVIGLVGISRDLSLVDFKSPEFEQLAVAINFVEQHLSESISVSDVAAIAGLSVYQLDRRMRLVYGVTTSRWILKLRIDRARYFLHDTTRSVVDIALATGYGDQSAFTRQFRQVTGYTPSKYRELVPKTE